MQSYVYVILLATVTFIGCSQDTDLSEMSKESLSGGPYQTTGFKVGEVTSTEAIIWARTTRGAVRVSAESPMPEFLYRNPENGELIEGPDSLVPNVGQWDPVFSYPPGATVETIEGAAPGAKGQVRVRYRPTNQSRWATTDWEPVDPERDFTKQIRLQDLQPGMHYELEVEARAPGVDAVSSSLQGRFKTAPRADDPARIVFALSSCQEYITQDAPSGGFKIYPSILEINPDFYINTGDIIYYDRWAKNLELARWVWARMFSLPTNFDFHRQISSYFIKDDHDTWMNDAWPGRDVKLMGDFTFAEGQSTFLEQVPMGGRTYRTYRWGKDVQIWMVEGRDYRSPNTDPDGPEKTIWGAEQMAWFKDTVEKSDATFKILVSPTPIVGPDRDNKFDNHANIGFQFEGSLLRNFIAQQDNMIVITGDRHWQYVSIDSQTGLREYSIGPASNEHADGWRNDDIRPEHQYLNVVGGFMTVTSERLDATPRLILRHHGVDGNILNEDTLVATIQSASK
jgi:alkaline phosphatase D